MSGKCLTFAWSFFERFLEKTLNISQRPPAFQYSASPRTVPRALNSRFRKTHVGKMQSPVGLWWSIFEHWLNVQIYMRLQLCYTSCMWVIGGQYYNCAGSRECRLRLPVIVRATAEFRPVFWQLRQLGLFTHRHAVNTSIARWWFSLQNQSV